MSDDLMKALCSLHKQAMVERSHFYVGSCAMEAMRRIEELEAENEKLLKALDIYERERNRFKHAKPEITGAYFLSGGHGPTDVNQMPQFVEVVPAYGCDWSMIYENTGRTISYEGS